MRRRYLHQVYWILYLTSLIDSNNNMICSLVAYQPKISSITLEAFFRFLDFLSFFFDFFPFFTSIPLELSSWVSNKSDAVTDVSVALSSCSCCGNRSSLTLLLTGSSLVVPSNSEAGCSFLFFFLLFSFSSSWMSRLQVYSWCFLGVVVF